MVELLNFSIGSTVFTIKFYTTAEFLIERDSSDVDMQIK